MSRKAFEKIAAGLREAGNLMANQHKATYDAVIDAGHKAHTTGQPTQLDGSVFGLEIWVVPPGQLADELKKAAKP